MTEEIPAVTPGTATARGFRGWVFAVSLVVAVGVGVGAGALVWAGDPAQSADQLAQEGHERCVRQVMVNFTGTDPDPAMFEAADQLRGDARFESVRTRTRQEAFEEFKRIFAHRPELLDKARPEALPAAVILMTPTGDTAEQVKPDLQTQFPSADVQTLGSCSG